MKKKLLKILIYVSIFSMLLTLCSGFASAVDPVSTATMANALAQAITAYGASHGVSMTFDVASTDGIGEGMHELWNDFKTYINDNNVPTYDSLAMTMWATIYTKIGNFVGININDTEMPYIDAFWNWLLSGPAQMTKVDNQYYEWSMNQNNTVDPIVVGRFGVFLKLPIYNPNGTLESNYQNGVNLGVISANNHDAHFLQSYYANIDVYSFAVINSTLYDIYFVSSNSYNTFYTIFYNSSNTLVQANASTNNSYQSVYYGKSPYTFSSINNLPIFSSYTDGLDSFIGVNNGTDTIGSALSVQPYVGDTSPQDVYIPNNEDVNYSPLPYVGGLDIPWNDTLYGDGTGTLTDAQKQEITSTIDNDITDSLEKTITLATDDPETAPNEVYIPFLPLQLPNFNFSFSGIWHYVVTWVGTLGSWFTAMFNMWSCLPYAMVVPVYATLVVVIVLGVYRRFLS